MASKVLKASVIIGGSISGSLRSALGNTKDGLKKIGDAITDVNRKQRALGKTISDFTGYRVKNIDALRAQYAALGREADRLRLAQQRLLTTQKAIDANMAHRSALRGQMGGAIGAAVGVALPVGSSIANAAKYNRQNQLIGNTANMTAAEIKALNTVIMDTAKDANQMTDEVQRGIGFLVAAGLDINTAKASIRTIGRTTTATGGEIEDLSKAAFTLIDALKFKPTELQGALDILALAGKEGNVELKDMAKVLPVLGSSFVALKMEGKEAAATMGAALEVARKGAADADEAANNMKNYLAKVMSPETLKKAKKNFNLDLYKVIQDAQKSGKNPFEASMMAIMKATKGDQKAIGDLFQDMQVQNFIRPMIQNWEDYLKIKKKALEESAGTTDRDFAKMMETEAEKMKAAKIAADQLAKTFGTLLGPTVGAAAEKIGTLLNRTTEFVKKNPALVIGVTKTVVALTSLRVAALGVGYAWTFIKGPVLSTMGFIARWRAAGAVAALGRFGATGLRALGIVRWIGAALAAIGGGPVTVAVAALVGAAILVRKYWEPIKAYFSGLWEGFSTFATPAIGEFVAALKPLAPLWNDVKVAIGGAIDWLMNLIAPSQMTGEQLTTVAKIGRIVGTVLGWAFKNAVGAATLAVKAVIALKTVAGGIGAVFASQFELVKKVVGAAVAFIMFQLKPLTNAIGWIADKTGAIGKIGDVWSATKNAVGMGAAPAPATSITSGRAPPNVPTAATSRGAAAAGKGDNVTINVTQQPGESGEALARRVVDEQERRKGVRARGSLGDGAG
ncbi:MAG TPA: phage tail tape measure protein [Pyrinomonadaceae bacterium]|nr:phage tail tape measure protein [Pyrinomonadaceae bacterium]